MAITGAPRFHQVNENQTIIVVEYGPSAVDVDRLHLEPVVEVDFKLIQGGDGLHRHPVDPANTLLIRVHRKIEIVVADIVGRHERPERAAGIKHLAFDIPTCGDEHEEHDQEHRRNRQQHRFEPERKLHQLFRGPRLRASAPTAQIVPMRINRPQVLRVGTIGK